MRCVPIGRSIDRSTHPPTQYIDDCLIDIIIITAAAAESFWKLLLLLVPTSLRLSRLSSLPRNNCPAADVPATSIIIYTDTAHRSNAHPLVRLHDTAAAAAAAAAAAGSGVGRFPFQSEMHAGDKRGRRQTRACLWI